MGVRTKKKLIGTNRYVRGTHILYTLYYYILLALGNWLLVINKFLEFSVRIDDIYIFVRSHVYEVTAPRFLYLRERERRKVRINKKKKKKPSRRKQKKGENYDCEWIGKLGARKKQWKKDNCGEIRQTKRQSSEREAAAILIYTWNTHYSSRGPNNVT